MDISGQWLSSNLEFYRCCSSKISCYDSALFWFFKREMHLIRNMAQENLGNPAHRNCSRFVPPAGAKLKATWSMLPCPLTEVSAISGELYSWTCCSTMHHPWPDGVDKVHLASAEISLHKPVHQQLTHFSYFLFCWSRTFPNPISEANYWYLLIITLHTDMFPFICMLIWVMSSLGNW